MTTQAQRFAKLLETFTVVYDDSDQIEYILKDTNDFDMPLLFDSKGNKVLCELCEHQLAYDSGSTVCLNEDCNSEYIVGNRVNEDEYEE